MPVEGQMWKVYGLRNRDTEKVKGRDSRSMGFSGVEGLSLPDLTCGRRARKVDLPLSGDPRSRMSVSTAVGVYAGGGVVDIASPACTIWLGSIVCSANVQC